MWLNLFHHAKCYRATLRIAFTLVHALPAHFPASVFVVLHIPARKPSALPTLLCHAGPLRAFHPIDHALIEIGQVRLSKGLKEKGSWSAIDPLFRSAAQAYGPRVVGAILTGARDDGTAGLLAVKRSGGVAIVPDPDSARFSAMPRSALACVTVDDTVPLSGIAPLLVRLVAFDDSTSSLLHSKRSASFSRQPCPMLEKHRQQVV